MTLTKMKNSYTEDSIKKMEDDRGNIFCIENGHRKILYTSGQVLGKYGIVFIEEIEPTDKRKRRYGKFKCPLCGNIFEARIDSVKRGEIKSCGCIKKITSSNNAYIMLQKCPPKGDDITNKKFNSLTAIRPTDKRDRSGNIYWFCECDCGGSKEVTVANLKNGHVKYCNNCYRKRKALSCVSKKFGKIKILNIIDDKRDSNDSFYCLAKCDCGNIVELPLNRITRSKNSQQSCGQCSISKGELAVKKILEENNIIFEQQKTFAGCMNFDTGRNLRFDFYLPNQKICIEYNGAQHYEPCEYFGGIKRFKEQKEKDEIKKSFCEENGYRLIIIPYTDFNILSLEYLLERGVKYE